VHITAQGPHVRNDLYCVEWDVKLYYIIPLVSLYKPMVRSYFENCSVVWSPHYAKDKALKDSTPLHKNVSKIEVLAIREATQKTGINHSLL